MSAAQPAALLVRHAETDWSRDGRHTGSSDIPLTAAGRDAARVIAHLLAGREIARVLVSPLRRARETCELCGLGGRAEVRDDLREWDYGDYEGLTSAQIHERRRGWSLWRDGCPGGESAADVGARADRIVAELAGPGGTAALFSHGHMLRVLGARWTGFAPEMGERFGLSTASISELGHEHGVPILASWNLTARD